MREECSKEDLMADCDGEFISKVYEFLISGCIKRRSSIFTIKLLIDGWLNPSNVKVHNEIISSHRANNGPYGMSQLFK